MFCEFPSACLICGASFVVSIDVPDSLGQNLDGRSFGCKCPKCGAGRGGLVPNFTPLAWRAIRSPDIIEGNVERPGL